MRHFVLSPYIVKRQTALAFRARELRGSLNLPQQMLWDAVASGRLGVYFRREVPLLGRYIVDMLAPVHRARRRSRWALSRAQTPR